MTNMRSAVITGGVRKTRFVPALTRGFTERARTRGLPGLDVIDLAGAPLDRLGRYSGALREARPTSPYQA
ncbi:hypothetical protein [Nonomuraea sp. NPDC050643]|uniref:hypothetical protein n=1 Tax=Nonomuraea sp. NPDC050643 TaxID=3155660 RepID=UPI0034066A84